MPQAPARAAKADNVQENVVYESQLQADHVIALTGPRRTRHWRRGLHVSITDITNDQRSIVVPSRGPKATSGVQLSGALQ